MKTKHYEAPLLQVDDFWVEQGFALSDQKNPNIDLDYGEEDDEFA